jgi:hypothetical protein
MPEATLTPKEAPQAVFLSREAIFSAAAESLKPKTVEVPEWGGNVQYTPLTMSTRREIRKKCMVLETNLQTAQTESVLDVESFEIYALIYCVIDPDKPGKKLFNPGDKEALESQFAAGPISTVSTAIMTESGLAPDAIKRGEDGTAV